MVKMREMKKKTSLYYVEKYLILMKTVLLLHTTQVGTEQPGSLEDL